MKQPPVASTHPNNYTPRPYAPVSTYAPFNPPSYPAPTLTNLPKPPATANTAYHPTPSAPVLPQPPPPTSSALTRPKLINAYDPPFLLTKPSRRTGRLAGDAHQTVRQSPDSPAPHESDTVVPNAYAGTDYRKSTPLHEAVREASPDISRVLSHPTRPPTVPPKAEARTLNSGSNSTHYQNAYVSGAETPAPQSYQENVVPLAVHSNGDAESYNLERNFSSPETARSQTPRSSSISSNPSFPRSEKPLSLSRAPSNTSPSKVPLPYSPPGPPVQAAFDTSIRQDSLAEISSQCSPHVSPQLSRRALNYDVYAPSSSNHLPRAASPLQNQLPPSESGKIPAFLNLNEAGSTPYNAVQRDMTIPFMTHESDHTSVEGLSPRHPLSLRESTRKFSVAQYAPSPSLVGANDPLSRTSSRAPVVTFGFGGKMITCFHGMPGLNAGFDVALSARTLSELKVRILQKVLPESGLNSSGPSYPGPLFSDPGTPSLSLVRSATSSQAKLKKSGLITYLLGRVEEINQGLGFLSPLERQHAENKLILVKVLKALVENDGRFFGS